MNFSTVANSSSRQEPAVLMNSSTTATSSVPTTETEHKMHNDEKAQNDEVSKDLWSKDLWKQRIVDSRQTLKEKVLDSLLNEWKSSQADPRVSSTKT